MTDTTDFPPLPEHSATTVGLGRVYTAEQMREYVQADRASRAGQPDRNTIRKIFMAHGFTIKDGQTDLKPYVYEAAEALLAGIPAAPPAPVADDVRAALVAVVEQIARQWDGCEYDAPGGVVDIGDSIRRAALSAQLPEGK